MPITVDVSDWDAQWIDHMVQTGDYPDRQAVVAAALRALMGPDLADGREAVRLALSEADRGEAVPAEEAFTSLRNNSYRKGSNAAE